MVEAKITLTQPTRELRQFVAETGSGHHLILDDQTGGTGPKPVELVSVALAGCTAFDVINILRKKRQLVTAYEVEVRAQQREEPPMYFTKVEVTHRLHGTIDPEAVKSAIHLSETKYCSVGAMISKTATIESTFEIIPDAVLASPVGIEL